MKKFDNFCKALQNLNDIYDYEEPYNNVTLTGLVALYEICFEQAWKAMKELLIYNGIESAASGSPRSIIKDAYSVKMVTNEELWLLALTSRNNVAHAYNASIAYDIVRDTKSKYVKMFEDLKEVLKKGWIEG